MKKRKNRMKMWKRIEDRDRRTFKNHDEVSFYIV